MAHAVCQTRLQHGTGVSSNCCCDLRATRACSCRQTDTIEPIPLLASRSGEDDPSTVHARHQSPAGRVTAGFLHNRTNPGLESSFHAPARRTSPKLLLRLPHLFHQRQRLSAGPGCDPTLLSISRSIDLTGRVHNFSLEASAFPSSHRLDIDTKPRSAVAVLWMRKKQLSTSLW